MDFFKHNLAILRQRSPITAVKAGNVTDTENAFTVRLTQQNGQSIWQCGDQSGTWPRAAKIPATPLDPEQRLIILYGIGDGSYAQDLSQIKSADLILVYEPSLTLFQDLLRQKDLRPVLQDEKFHFIVGTDSGGLLNELEMLLQGEPLFYYFAGFHNTQIQPGIQHISGYQPYFMNFAAQFRQALQNHNWRLRNEAPEDAFWGFLNFVRNVKNYDHLPNLETLGPLFQDRPGIVVGSGPSLKFSLPHLREIQDKVVIFSCDSTLKILLKAGIRPHFVGILERSPWQAKLLEEISPDDTPTLIMPCVAHPDVFKVHHGAKLAIHRDAGFDAWLYPTAKRYFLGQLVSHLGFTSLALLGCKKIFLVGLDSCYSPHTNNLPISEAMYDENSTEHMKKISAAVLGNPLQRKYDRTALGYDGKTKHTNHFLLTATQDFGEMIASFDLDVKNVMPVDHGLPIPRTERIDPAELEKLTALNTALTKEKLNASLSQLKPSSHDHRPIFSQTRIFLEQLKKECRQKSVELSQFFFENNPQLPEFRPCFKDYFYSIEAHRHRIMNDTERFFERALYPILANQHAIMEHNLRSAFQLKDEEIILDRQTQLYMGWYDMVLVWSEKMLTILEKIA